MSASGLSELRQGLANAPDVARERVAGAVSTSTFSTANRVRNLAPQDTGTLRRAIASSARGLRGRVTIGPEAHYWKFIEYGYYRGFSGLGGRRYVAARPFVRAAIELEADPFVRRVEDVVRSISRDFSASRFV